MKVFKRQYSIVTSLTFWYSSATFLILSASSINLYFILAKTLRSENNRILYDHVQTLHSILNRTLDPIGSVRRRIESEWILKDFQRVFVKLQDSNGILISQSPQLPSKLENTLFPLLPIQTEKELVQGARRVEDDSENYYLIFAEDLGKVLPEYSTVHLYIALNVSHEEFVLKNYRSRLLLTLSLAFLLSVWIGRQFAVRGFKPVTEIVETADKIRSSTLHERIQTREWSVEIQTLARTFNKMLDRLEESFDRLSLFSADIAHEIRTPVSSIVGTIEVTLRKDRSQQEYRDVLSSCLEEGVRIRRIVESLLFVAKAENPETKIRKEMIDLQEELSRILEFYEIMASEGGITLELLSSPSVFIPVEKTLFQRAIGNLLSNSIEHTPSSGKIVVQFFDETPEPNSLSIVISDTGEGIPKEHLSRVFDRFYRADESRTPKKNAGFGLGLTIVRGIIHLHKGNMRIESEPGKGTQVTLVFPKTQAYEIVS